MNKKPTYEELEHRVKELEKETVDRKLVEGELRGEKEQYRSIIHKIQAAVVVHDADTRIINCNSKAQELLGLNEDQLLGKEAIDPEWKFLNANGEKMSIELYPVNQVLASRQPLRDFYVGINRPNNANQVWVLVSAIPVFDHKENLQQVIVTFMDLTERKQMEDALRESEERFRILFSVMAEGVVLINPGGQIVHANPAAERMLGLRRSDIESRNYISPDWKIIRPDGTSMPAEEMAGPRAMKEKRPVVNVVMGVVRPDNAIAWLNVSAAPIISKTENIDGIVGTFADITERKKAEEEREVLIRDLQAALAKIKTLSGIIPICAKCKKIRDDKGYWNQVEVYIRDHTEAEFSHGLCPECVAEMEKEIDEME